MKITRDYINTDMMVSARLGKKNSQIIIALYHPDEDVPHYLSYIHV